jgi:hypothetical protein
MDTSRWMATLGVALGSAALAPTLAAQRTLGLDARHAYAAGHSLADGPEFAAMRAELGALGFQLVPRTVFGAPDLAGLDGVLLFQPYVEGYTAGEVQALAAFAAAGGGVVILAEGGATADNLTFNLDALAAPYGVAFASAASSPSGLAVQPLAGAHALVAGVDSIGVDFHRRLAQIAAPAADLTALGGEHDVQAVVDDFQGGGDVVLLADSTLFTTGLAADFDLDDADNRRLLRNLAVVATSGRDDFVVLPFDPGVAGATNALRAYECAPARRVFFAASLTTGSTPLPACGVTLGLAQPLLLGSALADAGGTAALAVAVPPSGAGITVHVQALQLGPCGASNVLRAAF